MVRRVGSSLDIDLFSGKTVLPQFVVAVGNYMTNVLYQKLHWMQFVLG